jgi:hypothetical protein
MGKNQCQVVCDHTLTNAEMHRYQLIGSKHFEYKLILDDLPSATIHHGKQETPEYNDTIPIVDLQANKSSNFDNTIVYNHLNLLVQISPADGNNNRIVGFDVEPMSIDWSLMGGPC